ncbi:hypoxanthine-guanine phosphoribosyltransferase [Clostridium thermobutyricum DSM 4928]|jgi:hypoxanthine phosphoribosyltransferase|uniref:Hypoxanthine phosphoribosyltransferase n=2 Tax=Clostridium thermobutyricum TaxID=29372 RepID=A0A1V4STA9_9CLOT|nr:hypoxanthine-guanine phosphoribosyltransferase [Clostridium thermobutyricum DSM 4928]
MMRDEIKKVLFTEEDLQLKCKELGEKITKDYEDKDLLVVGVLKGSVLFTSDLIKNIKIPCEIDFMAVSSYGNSTESSGVVRILKDLDNGIEGKDVLIVEDIVDTGNTLSYLKRYLNGRGANSVKIITLLDKPERRTAEVEVDYIGFEVPNEFIVGYGIDYAEKYRNLPFVGILDEKVYSK